MEYNIQPRCGGKEEAKRNIGIWQYFGSEMGLVDHVEMIENTKYDKALRDLRVLFGLELCSITAGRICH